MVGLNDTITLSFMIAGHTKFSPDSCFGLLKQQFRKTCVDTLKDLSDVVEKSASCNTVEMVGWEDGIPLIPTYNWQSYFADKMVKVKGIKNYQHFTFTNSKKGQFFVECHPTLLPLKSLSSVLGRMEVCQLYHGSHQLLFFRISYSQRDSMLNGNGTCTRRLGHSVLKKRIRIRPVHCQDFLILATLLKEHISLLHYLHLILLHPNLLPLNDQEPAKIVERPVTTHVHLISSKASTRSVTSIMSFLLLFSHIYSSYIIFISYYS